MSNQSCGSGYVSGYSISSESGSRSIRIQCVDDQKLKKINTAEIFIYIFFYFKIFSDVQASGEAFSHQKRTSST
jgi:hypothetical protein